MRRAKIIVIGGSAGSLQVILGILPAVGHPFIRSPVPRQFRCAKHCTSFGNERIDKDRFGLVVNLVKVQARTSKTFGNADFNPIARPVAGSRKALGIDKPHGQEHRMKGNGHAQGDLQGAE